MGNVDCVVMPFDGSSVDVIKDKEGNTWVGVRSICKAIGIESKSQIEKIRADKKFNWGDIPSVALDGKKRKMFCIALNHLNLWLAGINSSKVRADVKPRLLAYQQECSDVLYKHFMPRGEVDLSAFMQRFGDFECRVQERFDTLDNVCRGLRDEVDELRAALDILIGEDDAKIIRELIMRIKKEKDLDGRAIVGHIRKTLNVGSIYKGADTNVVINVLRNMLGEGVLGLVKPV